MIRAKPFTLPGPFAAPSTADHILDTYDKLSCSMGKDTTIATTPAGG